jgi:hypothetical protein
VTLKRDFRPRADAGLVALSVDGILVWRKTGEEFHISRHCPSRELLLELPLGQLEYCMIISLEWRMRCFKRLK